MRPTACLQALAPLLKKPFFTANEAKKLGVHPSVLSHYAKMGRLKRVRRGVYQGSSYRNPSTFHWDDLIEAVYSVKGGIVCLISALAIYDLTDEIPRKHWIAIRHGTSVKAPRQLKILRYRNMELGKTETNLQGTIVPIFDRERTIIDAFRLLSRETAIKALKTAVLQSGKNKLDLIKLEAYAKKLRFDITPYLLSVTT